MSNYTNEHRIISRALDDTFIPILESEYKEIVKAQKGLLEILYIEEEFDIVLENFYEYEMELVKYSMDYMLFFNDNRFANERNSINRRMMNLLSACRSYIDNGNRHLSNIDKSIMEKIKEKKKHEFDNVLGCEVMSALRNYAQHNGLPIQELKYGSNNPKKLKFSVTPYLNVQKLKEDGKFKPKTLDKLGAIGPRHDIKPLLRDYIGSIYKIHKKSRDLLKNHIEQWDKLLSSKIKKFESKYNSSIGLAAVFYENNSCTGSVPIVPDIIKRRIELETKNKKDLTSLKFWYV